MEQAWDVGGEELGVALEAEVIVSEAGEEKGFGAGTNGV